MNNLIVLKTAENETYTGRFVGFIKDDEFNALIQKPEEVATKLESKATQDIMKAATKFDSLKGYRLIMVLKGMDGEPVNKKVLYITEPLSLIDSVNPRTVNGDWNYAEKAYDPSPGKVTIQTANEESIKVQEAE